MSQNIQIQIYQEMLDAAKQRQADRDQAEAEKHARWAEQSENDARFKIVSTLGGSASIGFDNTRFWQIRNKRYAAERQGQPFLASKCATAEASMIADALMSLAGAAIAKGKSLEVTDAEAGELGETAEWLLDVKNAGLSEDQEERLLKILR